jgi:AbrB family looped-hinge helix DNA binding protein
VVKYILTSKNIWRATFMATVATTTLSSKGQVVIPEDVRDALGLEPGAQFVVMGDGDIVILKRIETPTRGEFRTLAAKARKQVRQAGLKPADVRKAVRNVRRRG